MAQIDRKTIKNLTKLSRIRCTEEEEEALLSDLQKILSYFEQLEEIDTSEVAPCDQVIPEMANVFREDLVGEVLPREIFLENAPSQIGGLIRVPPLLKT